MKTYHHSDLDTKEAQMRQELVDQFWKLTELIHTLDGIDLSHEDWIKTNDTVNSAIRVLRKWQPALKQFASLEPAGVNKPDGLRCKCGSDQFEELFRLILPRSRAKESEMVWLPFAQCKNCKTWAPQLEYNLDSKVIEALHTLLKGKGRTARAYMIEKVKEHPTWGAAELRTKYRVELKSTYPEYRRQSSGKIRRSFQYYIDKYRNRR